MFKAIRGLELINEIKNTYIYSRALAAAESKPYNVINLNHVIESIGRALNHVHAQGFFTDYTRHGPEHSVELVKSLDWIIEESQREKLLDADYLFLLLSCLIHDLGMITTQEEFLNRDAKTIAAFEEGLSKSDRGREFLASIRKDYRYRDEIIFEEFVRHHHAARVRSALLQDGEKGLGDVSRISPVLHDLFHKLDPKCIADLALICESHHKNDLDDLARYPIKSVHGTGHAQINIHAVSILLRVADVLQIGTGRTPSIDFSIISPTNPISHLHWMKEMGVRRVEGQIVPPKSPEDREVRQVLIYGRYDEAEPFFALQNHLKYANGELGRCVRWSRDAKSSAQDFQFLWEKIDSSQIETHGFEREQFSFQIDREKILSLLIGHTLYNDTRVVLRELVQNSIDAVRLKKHKDTKTSYQPRITVELNKEERLLTISDNGTGMTAGTIKSHLLTVGSSFYSTDEFSKEFPDFNAISRFGIGILTSFMIADEIEITTSHPDESKARQIKINGPSGTYLIKLIEKSQLPVGFLDRDHGTRIVLRIRPQSRNINLISELEHWFVFPGCELFAKVGDGEPTSIGYGHPEEFLSAILEAVMAKPAVNDRYYDFEVVNCDAPGLFDGAYVVRRSKYSKRAAIARTDEFNRRRPSEEKEKSFRDCGVFLQGVRVLEGSPGYNSEGPIAVINGIGKRVPRTNVARTGIEQGDEYQEFLREIYNVYLNHGRKEVDKWSAETKNTSLTTRGRKISYHISTLSLNASDSKLLQQKIDDEKRIVVERRGQRELISKNELLSLPEFDTVDSPFTKTAEELIENLTASRSLHDIITALSLPDVDIKSDVILTESSVHFDAETLDQLRIGRLIFNETSGQLSINWRRVENGAAGLERLQPDMRRFPNGSRSPLIFVPNECVGNENRWSKDTVILCEYGCLIHPNNSEIKFLRSLLSEEEGSEDLFGFKKAMTHVLSQLWQYHQERARGVEEVAAAYGRSDEAMATALKERIVPFRNMHAVRVPEDNRQWF